MRSVVTSLDPELQAGRMAGWDHISIGATWRRWPNDQEVEMSGATSNRSTPVLEPYGHVARYATTVTYPRM